MNGWFAKAGKAGRIFRRNRFPRAVCGVKIVQPDFSTLPPRSATSPSPPGLTGFAVMPSSLQGAMKFYLIVAAGKKMGMGIPFFLPAATMR